MQQFTLASLAVAALCAAGASADTITVCLDGSCDFTDPVAAVASAAPDDVIEIAAGIYPLDTFISIFDTRLVIRGAVDASGAPATVLDARGTSPVLDLVAIGSETVLENLVITNGRSDYGGAMFLYGANPVFRNCRMTGNIANWRGGAMFLNDSNPTLIACELSGNSAGPVKSTSQGSGGAIHVSTGSVMLVDSVVTGNTAWGSGGGISMSSAGGASLERSRVCGNTAATAPQIHHNAGAGWTDLGQSCVTDLCLDCPEINTCPADLNTDGRVDASDLSVILGSWGPCRTDCAADLDRSGEVNAADLAIALDAWGDCR